MKRGLDKEARPRRRCKEAPPWLRSAACASGATLQGAALIFAEATPDAAVLAGLESVLQTDLGHRAPGADGLGLVDLVDGGAGIAYGKEKFWVCCQASGFVAPIHRGYSLVLR